MTSRIQNPRAGKAGPARQRGVTLVIVLILLLVVTLIALASLRGTLMEERMSANVLDRSLAFQAAEAALREGESVAAGKPALPAAGCAAGLCAIPNPAVAPVWTDEAIWAAAPEAVVQLGDKTAKPRYIVELLANDVPPKGSCTTSGDVSETTCSGTERRYRVTARSEAEGRAAVMLQTIFAVP
ncbi:pilus assembly PilX family protein [Agrilutibacter solisilvae]|uniref:Pilus assembly protein n=1 Tax=Agrilutibacter solisilvae TaxID=2763317 RepID=A0A974XX87_9GAMM|nr:PilX N-terminal domain-containing pilus assembly protein [Lysobacter solisilvae]QSX77474.1 pilus assembly protein [Lysobacter solisilvae]